MTPFVHRLPRLALLAGAGAVAGTAAEMLHLRTGVWALVDASALPWWIAVIYFGAFLTFGIALDRWATPLPVTRARLGLEFAAFLVLLLAPSAMPSQEMVLLAITVGWIALRLLAFRERGDVAFAVGAALGNLAIEVPLVVLVGLYRYPSAHVLPVPLWLVPFWAGLALGLRRFFGFVSQRTAAPPPGVPGR